MPDRTSPAALVVKDEYLVSLHVEDLLRERGFDVVGPAARVKDALALIAATRDLALAVIDVNLAGENSWSVARALRSRGVPFMFVTGYHEMQAQRPADLIDVPLLPKPLDGPALAQAILNMEINGL